MPTGRAAAAVLCIMENVFHLNENEEMLLAVAQVQRLVGSLVWKTLMVCATSRPSTAILRIATKLNCLIEKCRKKNYLYI